MSPTNLPESNQRALSVILSPEEVASDLEGFSFIPSDGLPFISLDKHKRFYFNSSMRKLFGLKPYSQIAVGYNADTQAIAIVTKSTENLLPSFIYVLDKRCYTSARRFVNDHRITVKEEPITYLFDRNTSVDGVYIFRRVTQ